MALSSKDMKLRRDLINWYLDAIRVDTTVGLELLQRDVKDRSEDFKATTVAIQTSVLAEALGRNMINARQVPARLVPDVRKKFLKNAADEERDDAALTGTKIHKHAERLAQGEVYDIPAEHLRHVEVWRAFVEYYGVRFVDTEFTVFNLKYGYAGTGDFLAYFDARPEWGLILGDYKTSKSGIWASAALQLASIKYAEFIGRCRACETEGRCPNNQHPASAVYEDKRFLGDIKTAVGVQIATDVPQGKGKNPILQDQFHVVPTRLNRAMFTAFVHALGVADWKSNGEKFALKNDAEPVVAVKSNKELTHV